MPDRPPSVLIVTRTFPPDPAAVGQLVGELAAELAARGWRVGIATNAANSGQAEPIAGVEVRRVLPRFAFTRENMARRALSYLSIFPALLRAARDLPGPWDYVVTTSDPPLQVLLGPILRRSANGRVVQWSQDLYPELAEELGVLPRGGALAGIFRALSDWGLRRSNLVIVPGRCMAARLRLRGLAADSIRVVPNWSESARAAVPDRAHNPFRDAHGLEPAQLVVMYSGNFGLAHCFEAILDAAETLQTSRRDVVFLMVGDGPRAAAVREEAGRRALANMRFLPLQPREQLAESLGAADIQLVTMRENLSGLVVPSKFYGVLAAGRPCVFVGPSQSEVALTIGESGCGAVVGEADAAALVEAIIRYADDAEARARTGAKAAALAGRFSVATGTDQLVAAWRSTGLGGGEHV